MATPPGRWPIQSPPARPPAAAPPPMRRDERRPHNPLEAIGAEPYKERPEEAGGRQLFTWFFTLVAIGLVLVGAGMTVAYFSDEQNCSVVNQPDQFGAGGTRPCLEFAFFGIVIAGMGLVVNSLTVFDTFWPDRYLVHTLGILMVAAGLVFGIFSSTRWPLYLQGLLVMGVGLFVSLFIGIVNSVGWIRFKKHRASLFAGAVVFVTALVIALGYITSVFPVLPQR